MGASEAVSVNPRLLQTVLRHMESLRRSIEGDELYALIARVLRKHSRRGPIGTDCFSELYLQLEVFARDPVALATTRIKAKLLQQRIAPYLPEEESTTETLAEAKDAATDIPFESVEVERSAPIADTVSEAEVTPAKSGTLNERADDDRRENYEKLRRSEQDAWLAINDAMQGFDTLKQEWTSRLDELSQERDALERRLSETEQYLKSVETNHDKLRTELETTRRNPPRKTPKRITKLPRSTGSRLVTRDQFVQQLQAEISRVKRSGGSAALALLGIEDLQAIQAEHGTGADVAVLDCYAREILSNFRAYDIIGRYADETFVVLFPDTQREGAIRALEKAQKRATETHVRQDDRRFPLPRFYGALTVYMPGEEPVSWLQRAEASLVSAKEKEHDRLLIV